MKLIVFVVEYNASPSFSKADAFNSSWLDGMVKRQKPDF